MKTKKFTFPDSGETIMAPVVSVASFALKMQRKHARPKPPLIEVDYGDGKKAMEYNHADPDYPKLVRLWDVFVTEEAVRLAFARASKFKLTKKHLASVEKWKKENPEEWDENDTDRDLWFEEIAIQTNKDFLAWAEFIKEAGEPSEEVIQSTADGFPS